MEKARRKGKFAAMEHAAPPKHGFNSIPVSTWTADPDGRICYVSPRWSEWTGLGPQALLRDQWRNLVHPHDLPGFLRDYADAIARRIPLYADIRMRTGGAYKRVRILCEPCLNERGEVLGWHGVLLDIEGLHAAQNRFEVLEALPVIAWSADSDGWLDWYNARWYEYTGQTPEEARGWGWQAVHHPEDFPEVMRRWPRSIETGEPFEMEFRLRRHDGIYHWFLTRIEPMRDEAGGIVRWYGTNVDIDAQKKAEERSKRIAETVQDVFLPKSLPRLEDMRLDATYIAAEKDALIGGDWYDAFLLPDGRIAFSIGDVAGHGLDASMLVGRMRQAIFTLAFKGLNPAQILADANRILHHQNPGTFVTAIAGYISADHTRITYANAGHPHPIYVSEGAERSTVGESGIPLGVLTDAKYQNELLDVARDALVVLYTDGMTEFGRDIAAAERRLQAAAVLVAADPKVRHPARAIQEIVLDTNTVADDAVVLTIGFSGMQPVEDDRRMAPEKLWRFHSSDAFSAQGARLEVGAYLRRFAEAEEDIFTSELIVGELLANTVEHAPGLVEIHIDWFADQPIMTVRDAGPGMTRSRFALPDDPFDENGRGLFLVKQLAGDISVKDSPGFGSEIRVTLPIRRGKPAENLRLLDNET